MEENKNWDKIAKYLAGEANATEKLELEQWLTESDMNALELEKAKEAWEATAKFTFNPSVDAAWHKLDKQLEDENKTVKISNITASSKNFKSTYSFNLLIKIAAGIVLTIGLGLTAWILQRYYTSSGNIIIATTDEPKSIMLPDGSLVWLNRFSEISYHHELAGNEREVQLKGEAFFDVTRDESAPFIVYTGNAVTQVVGTSFNIRAREEENEVNVTVVSGKVLFGVEEKIMLEPGSVGIFNKSETIVKKEDYYNKNFLSWKTNTLVFHDEPVKVVLNDMAAYFGIEIEITAENINCRFTGYFTEPQLEEVLEVLELSIQLKYTKSAGKVIVSSVSCR